MEASPENGSDHGPDRKLSLQVKIIFCEYYF